MKRHITVTLAIFVTATSVTIAASSAMESSGTYFDQMRMLAIFVSISVCTHLILALSKQTLTRLAWAGCLLGTAFVQVSYFTYASQRAGEIRAQHSLKTTGIEQQLEVTKAALAAIQSRPVAIVAADLASSPDRRQRAALRAELTEAKRAAALSDDLVRLSATAATTLAEGTTDKVTALLAKVTGGSAAGIALTVYLGLFLVLEILGIALWREVLRHSETANLTPLASGSKTHRDPLADLRNAIASGKCRPTLTGIRVFLRCGQTKASEIRRALLKK
jgi:hypothetical protein